jgi:hypothetical protein
MYVLRAYWEQLVTSSESDEFAKSKVSWDYSRADQQIPHW